MTEREPLVYRCSTCGLFLDLGGTFAHWLLDGHKYSSKVHCSDGRDAAWHNEQVRLGLIPDDMNWAAGK